MRVKMLQTSVGPDHCWLEGSTYDLPDAVAEKLVARKAAVLIPSVEEHKAENAESVPHSKKESQIKE